MRAARWLVIVSAVFGLAVDAWIGRRELPLLQWLPVVTFVIGAALARVNEGFAFALPLSVAFIVPAIFQAAIGRFIPAYHVVWFGAMLGAVAGARGAWTRWSLPRAWVLPLATWAMLVAIAWPIVILREADFTPAWLTRIYHMATSNIGGPPPLVAIWVINCVLTLNVGLLWFDRLFAYADDPARFRRWVVLPLSIGAIASGALGVYQGLIDLQFLNAHQWPELGRAGGGLIDADGFGAGAGFWSAAFVALAAWGAGLLPLAVGTIGALVSWGGLWASGSRMALLAGLIGAAGIGVACLRLVFSARHRWPILIGAAVIVIAGLFVANAEWSTASPIARAVEDLPSLNRESLKAFARDQLFDRGAPYGTATVRMFQESPLVGIGIGTFNGIFPDYALMIVGARYPYDNAQSWYRQQFAEMGLLGVAGWLWWLATVAWLLVRTAGAREHLFSATVVKGALVAIALVTAVSLPTQDSFVALMPWMLTFWYLQLSPDARARVANWRAPGPVASGLIAWGWTLAFAALTLTFGLHHYRPSMRAVWANWTYTAGFYDMEEEPREGEPDNLARFQWSEPVAVQTVRVTAPWLKLRVSGGPPDMADNPVRLIISRRYQPVVDVLRSSPEEQTWYIAAGDEQQMIVGIRTSRGWSPGGADLRNLGVRVERMVFADAPPPGANVVR